MGYLKLIRFGAGRQHFMSDKYLQHANPKEFHYIVSNGWAISPSYNGEYVCCSVTDLQNGVYNQDNERVDSQVGDPLRLKLNKTIKGTNQTLLQYIEFIVLSFTQDKIKSYSIVNYPNVTKALATNLSKIYEAAIFNEVFNEIEFVCFAARKSFINYMIDQHLIVINPEYLYYGLTDNKNNFGFVDGNIFVVHDKPLTKFSIIGIIDFNKRMDFLTEL